jgi:transcriptional regulator with XRE-family HTH domain
VGAQTGKRLKADLGWGAEHDSHRFSASVGERIRVARQQKGWTQVELAAAAALSSNYVARLERGELGASLFVAAKLAEALDVTLDVLVPSQGALVRAATKRRAG